MLKQAREWSIVQAVDRLRLADGDKRKVFILTNGGVMIGDVVGLGKTLMATALARVFEDDYGLETLIICPKNLVPMWEDSRGPVVREIVSEIGGCIVDMFSKQLFVGHCLGHSVD